jgi:hypothetical protein
MGRPYNGEIIGLAAPSVPPAGECEAMKVANESPGPRVYEMKVVLDGSTPAIWRRIRVASNVSLARLHRILQATMGWGSYHRHLFVVRGRYYGRPDPEGEVYDERQFTLGQVVRRAGDRFTYEYDLGDGWIHEVLVERILPPEPGPHTPVCVAGERACPPEDVGGLYGYYEFLDALQNAVFPGHERALEWIGGSFDPDAFDLETVNRRLRQLARRRHKVRTP